VLSDVRARLDDDLDTPGALRVIDEAAAAGSDVSDAAALVGVSLVQHGVSLN
jgi:L-cysteine:1D-myo-inositol 2-amino-2-deoxy-alpha-D-glucopyranoside ligase